MPTLDLGSVVGPQGPQGATGPQGPQGIQGAAGLGVPTGGSAGQALVKLSATNYDTGWSNVDTYHAGDTFNIDGAVGCGITSSAGTSFGVMFTLPKKLPSSLTISHNLTVNWIRSNGNSFTGSVTAVERLTDNVLRVTLSCANAGALVPIFVNFTNGTITFS